VQEHCSERETKIDSPFYGAFFLLVLISMVAAAASTAAAAVVAVVELAVVVVVVVVVVIVQILVTEIVEINFPQLLTNHQNNIITVNSKL